MRFFRRVSAGTHITYITHITTTTHYYYCMYVCMYVCLCILGSELWAVYGSWKDRKEYVDENAYDRDQYVEVCLCVRFFVCMYVMYVDRYVCMHACMHACIIIL